jgi:GNAT superfamily N-acetyltransferase
MFKLNKKEYPLDDIEIIELTDATSLFLNDFECELKELKDFLIEDALNQSKQSINRTFLWISKKEKILLSYITICADAISLDGIKKTEMREVGIKYKSLPSLKIGRMAVHKNYVKRGIGKRMVSFAISRALKVNEECACRFITLDAKNDEVIPNYKKPIHFYKKIGFLELKRRPKNNTVHMYKDIIDIISPRLKP